MPFNKWQVVGSENQTLQDEWRDHVGNEEMKLRTELKNALQHESAAIQSTAQPLETDCTCRDSICEGHICIGNTICSEAEESRDGGLRHELTLNKNNVGFGTTTS